MKTLIVEYAYYQSPVGILKFIIENDKLIEVSLSDVLYNTTISNQMSLIIKQMDEYFKKERQAFEVKYLLKTSAFTSSVLKAAALIPYGLTYTYGELSKLAFGQNKARAVGQALSRNPLMIIIPCHRVIGSNHQLVGYNGGLSIKSYLLELEQSQ